MNKKAIFNWSGGKDSALALHRVMREGHYQVGKLITTVNSQFKRISMHGVREELLEQQAHSIGIPLHKIMLPEQPDMEMYNRTMKNTMEGFHNEGYRHSIFGDIFLEDLKKYRENQLKEAGFKACFPLWKNNTRDLLKEFLDSGFKTIVVCIKSNLLDKSFTGRVIDEDFPDDLPEGVDPCGENGEFHTFVYDGPIFKNPVTFKKGALVYREYKAPKSTDHGSDLNAGDQSIGFWYCDLIPD